MASNGREWGETIETGETGQNGPRNGPLSAAVKPNTALGMVAAWPGISHNWRVRAIVSGT